MYTDIIQILKCAKIGCVSVDVHEESSAKSAERFLACQRRVSFFSMSEECHAPRVRSLKERGERWYCWLKNTARQGLVNFKVIVIELKYGNGRVKKN